jgi:nickel transport protein
VSRAALLGIFAGALLVAERAGAHETLHEVARGKALAVKVYFADGEVLAYTAFEVYSPADPKIPYLKGRTDRSGWLAFVPDAPGKWRIKVIDQTGHGLDTEVEAEASAAPSTSGGAVSSAAFILRPVLGLAVIGAVFAALLLVYRKKGTAP